MNNALVGYTGFIGSTILRQTSFKSLYCSSNIEKIKGNSYQIVVCAAAPAQKWLANKESKADLKNINNLIFYLKSIQCTKFVLISTVDVFKNPNAVNENSFVDEEDLHPYGLHRRLLEKFIQKNFFNYLIVRLPGVIGPGLRKNIIYDFLNNNNLQLIDSRSTFQFYPVKNLWSDIQKAINAELKLVHFTSQPINVAEVASKGFDKDFNQFLKKKIDHYDMHTLYAELFGSNGNYQYNLHEVYEAIRNYAQSEPLTIKSEVKNK
jgi:hypothetical protein